MNWKIHKNVKISVFQISVSKIEKWGTKFYYIFIYINFSLGSRLVVKIKKLKLKSEITEIFTKRRYFVLSHHPSIFYHSTEYLAHLFLKAPIPPSETLRYPLNRYRQAVEKALERQRQKAGSKIWTFSWTFEVWNLVDDGDSFNFAVSKGTKARIVNGDTKKLKFNH